MTDSTAVVGTRKELPADQRTGLDINALMMAALKEGEGAVAALEKLVDLEERVSNREAVRLFNEAFTAFRADLPAIPRTTPGAVRDGRRVMYSNFETIQKYVDPPLAKHGFTYRFTTRPSQDGQWLIITCVLSHEAGHSEHSSMPVPMTSIPKASKAQEATGTRTYGKRITLSDVLGISTVDDTDGAGEDGGAISEEQIDTIRGLILRKDADNERLLQLAGAESWAELPVAKYDMVVNLLNAKADA